MNTFISKVAGFATNFLYRFFRSLPKMILHIPLLIVSPVVAWLLVWSVTLAFQYPDTLLGTLVKALLFVPTMLLISILFEWYQERLDHWWVNLRLKNETAKKWDWLYVWMFDPGFDHYSSRLGWLAGMMVGIYAYFAVGVVLLGALVFPYAPWLLPVFPTNP
jgi:hypothetical protein